MTIVEIDNNIELEDLNKMIKILLEIKYFIHKLRIGVVINFYPIGITFC